MYWVLFIGDWTLEGQYRRHKGIWHRIAVPFCVGSGDLNPVFSQNPTHTKIVFHATLDLSVMDIRATYPNVSNPCFTKPVTDGIVKTVRGQTALLISLSNKNEPYYLFYLFTTYGCRNDTGPGSLWHGFGVYPGRYDTGAVLLMLDKRHYFRVGISPLGTGKVSS